MKVLCGLIIPVFLVTLGGCKKPVLEITDGKIPPLVLTTAIEDSLPPETIRALNLSGLTGIKIQYHSGLHNSYFEYDADQTFLLDTISNLPFPLNAGISDTRCRAISYKNFKSVRNNSSATELENTVHFWDTPESKYRRFECIKPPYKHILQMENGSNHILHRIELLEQS